MNIEINVPMPDVNSVKNWMLNNGWEEVKHLKSLTNVIVLERTDTGFWNKLYLPWSDEYALMALKAINFGHPTRSILQLYAEIEGIQDLDSLPLEYLITGD